MDIMEDMEGLGGNLKNFKCRRVSIKGKIWTSWSGTREDTGKKEITANCF